MLDIRADRRRSNGSVPLLYSIILSVPIGPGIGSPAPAFAFLIGQARLIIFALGVAFVGGPIACGFLIVSVSLVLGTWIACAVAVAVWIGLMDRFVKRRL